VLATWVSRIPLLTRELGLDTAELSVALLGSPVGLILATQLVVPVVHRSSSAAVTRWGAVAACACVVLPSLAWNLPSLTVALFLLGTSLGALDTAMNTQGVAIERGYARPIMSGSTACTTSASSPARPRAPSRPAADVDPTVHFAVAGALLAR
jgi:hypothetical protein